MSTIMNKKTKILFFYQKVKFYPQIATFIQEDFDILKKYFDVTLFHFNIRDYVNLPFRVHRSDLVFIWFANYHAFIPIILAKLMGKPTVIVTGGHDVAYEKEVNYGLMRSPISRFVVKFILKNASKVLAVSEFNKKEAEKHLKLKTIEVLYNSVDVNRFVPKGKKENSVMIVSAASDFHRIRLKGIDKFIEAAKSLPDLKFIVIGLQEEAKKLLGALPSNVTLILFIPQDELLKYYQKAKVYCQLSFYESFGMTSAEAMSCGCVPVVTNKGGLPEVVGDVGYLVDYGNLDQIVTAIKKALNDTGKRGKARKRIMERFSLEIRDEKLKQIIYDLVK